MSNYTVVKGDTLSGIGAKLGINWGSIATCNGIESPYLIKPGQLLKLPSENISNYTVVSGDTLSGIGAKLGIDWESIATCNGMESPYLIKPGQLLKLPVEKVVTSTGMNLDQFVPGAQAMQTKTGFPASVTLAQIILESSGSFPGGVSGLAYNAHNLFGIKGVGPAGSYSVQTREVINGHEAFVQASFRKYHNYDESIQDHAAFLSGPRYVAQFKNAKSINDYCNGLQKAGYATDPNYASSLISIIGKYNLHQYDTGNFPFHP